MSEFFKRSPSELCREAALARERADRVLRAAKQSERSLHRQIEMACCGVRWRGRLYRWVSDLVASSDRLERDAVRTLLFAAADIDSPMLGRYAHVRALVALAKLRGQWIRPLAAWRPRTHNVDRQFAALARHLLARYPVPRVFDAAFFEGPHLAAQWFIHIGLGNNLRTAAGLPFPLTKMMAHHALLAPADDAGGGISALRWGQVRGLGGSERLAAAVVASRLRDSLPDEPFWLTVIQFFVANPMLDPQQVGPIVDFLLAQRFHVGPARLVNGAVEAGVIPQPNLSMKGRTVATLLRQMHQWHRHLARGETKAGDGPACWLPSGIAGYERVEGAPPHQRLFRIVELLTSHELRKEGGAMRHCVASYAHSCAARRCAIFSLREEDGSAGAAVRRLTIEVVIQNRRIVQARGRFNTRPDGVDERILRAWATTAGLSVAPTNRM
jgi:hypothetical protein